ncbi:hypothetical protein Tco_0810317 [Tanacetum coccineum]
MDAAAGSGWTNEAEEAFQMIKRKLNKLQTLAIPKEGETLMLCLRQRNETISSVLMCKIRGRKEAEGSVLKKFFGQGEQVQKTPGANEGETSNLNKELQVKLIPTQRASRLYLGKETIKEGSGVGIILVSPDEKMHSYAIRLKFNASDHAIDCEALLAGLVASINKGLATIKLEFLNQEVLVGIKTRSSVEEISSNASAKLTRAELNKRSKDANLSKDKSGPESPPEFRRSWYVEGHIRSAVNTLS